MTNIANICGGNGYSHGVRMARGAVKIKVKRVSA